MTDMPLPSAEFLAPDGYSTTAENRVNAARRNEENANYLLRLEKFLDQGRTWQEADRLAKGDSQ
jgi:hypothetical protein